MLSGEVLHRFHVKRPLARGGMGELWLADDEQHHDVVLKTVREDLTDDVEVCRCFRREIDVTARLEHEHIVRHIAHGRWSGVDVLALEHISGASLADLLDWAALPLGAALCIAEDVARALAYLHAVTDDRGIPLNIVHGDVSPQNIIVDRLGQARLIDFGGVTMSHTAATAGSVVCKPGYASPEQSRGDAVDARSDQYALGIVLWEMLAGCTLFDGNSMRRDLPVPPLASMVSVPFAVEAAVIRMLAYEREARFETTEAAADAISGTVWAHGVEDSRAWLAQLAQEYRADHSFDADSASFESDESDPDERRTKPARFTR